jgi:hypothetical protein
MHIWSHPIDVHYSAADLSGWPKANFRIWRLNNANKLDTCINNIFLYNPYLRLLWNYSISKNKWIP